MEIELCGYKVQIDEEDYDRVMALHWGIVEKPTGASFKVSEIIKQLKNNAKINNISHVSVSVGAKSMKQTLS